MDFSRASGRAIVPIVLFAAGLGAGLAVWAGLWACLLLCVLAALGLGAWQVSRKAADRIVQPAPIGPEGEAVSQERRLRTLEALVDQTPAPLLMLEANTPLVAVNRAARRLFRTDRAILDPDPELLRGIAMANLQERRTVQFAVEDQERVFALSVADLAAGGRSLRLVALTDIQPEIQIAEAKALKALLQVLSHEIMNTLTPLTSLANSAADLLDDGGTEASRLAREAVSVIARRTDGLYRFVEAYRQLARLPEPRPRQLGLRELLRDAAKLFESRWGTQGVRLRVTYPDPDIIIQLDADLCTQAILSLLTNAAEATTEVEEPTVWLAACPRGVGAAITIEDNGVGVEPTIAREIFKPFFTTKAEGTGIGLSIARQAIISQGGDLLLETRAAGQGARFVIAF